MRSLLELCGALVPSRQWAKLAELPFQEDARGVRVWLADLLRREPPTDDIRSLWFGLFEERGRWRSVHYRLYASGSGRRAEAGSNDWALGPAWWPDGRYAPADVLARLPALFRPKGSEASSLADSLVALAYGSLTIADACRHVRPDLLEGPRGPRAVGVGHDAGDFVLLPSDEKRARAR